MTKQVILIADPQCLFIEGLKRIIHEKVNNVEMLSARTAREIVLHLEQSQPSLIFLNYAFIQQDFSAISPVIARIGYPEIIAVCDEWTEAAQKQAACLGVLSVVSKNCQCEDIWQVLERLTETAIPTGGQGHFSLNAVHHKIAGLTAQQHKILQLLTNGLTNREIGHRIGCAETTVKAHLNLAYKVLGVKNRTQATALLTQRVLPAA